jgi:glycosyltransferase involved in cell wall biosynthesis
MLEGLREVAGPTTDIEHDSAGQSGVRTDVRSRILGKLTVEPSGIGLFDPKGPEEMKGSPEGGLPRPRLDEGKHRTTITHPTRTGSAQLPAGRVLRSREEHIRLSRHVVFMNWRDTANPEGGGSEVFVEQMARGLVGLGYRATIICAAHDRAPADEVKGGIRFVRRGNHATVYARGWWLAVRRSLGHVDLYVDVQNGVPFFARLAGRTPVIVLVHHVHKEQWQVVFPGIRGRIGWFLESQVARRAFRGSQYVAVSRATRAELIRLGVRAQDIAVVHNGSPDIVPVDTERSPTPVICTLGRLVPHKQVEHAISAMAELRASHPDARLVVVGSGWWSQELDSFVHDQDLEDAVTFVGYLDETTKHEVLARSWVLALPSLKEGWGLVVSEAAQHAVPALAYRAAGGTTESVVDGVTGLLADDREDFVIKLRRLIEDSGYREKLGEAARRQASSYTWEHATLSFERIVDQTIDRRPPLAEVDPA